MRQLRARADERMADFIPALFNQLFGDPATNPKGWKVVNFVDVISSESNSLMRGPFGGAVKKEIFVPSGYKVYEQKNAIQDDFEIGTYFIDEAKYQELRAFDVHSSDLIISCSGTIGRIAIVPEGAKPGIINQALMKIRLDKAKVLPVFFKQLLETKSLQDELFGTAEGSAIKNVKPLKQIRLTKIPLPSLALQREFAARVAEARALQDQQARSRSRLEAGFQALLHRAFGGEL
jgi:type I restriction enzyme S subunit